MTRIIAFSMTPQGIYERTQRLVQREVQLFGAAATAAEGPRRSGCCWWSPLVAEVLFVCQASAPHAEMTHPITPGAGSR